MVLTGQWSGSAACGSVSSAPVAFFGTWLGYRMHYLLSEEKFYFIINLLLFMTGLKLVYDGCIGLFAF